jgi:hypothetical protein
MTSMTPEDGRYTAAYWQRRAEEARLQTKEMGNAGSRAMMAMIAEVYDRMAARAQAQEVKDHAAHPEKRHTDPETIREMALRHVHEQEARIAEQKEIIETLTAAGQSTVLVREVLETMELTLAAMRTEVDRYPN